MFNLQTDRSLFVTILVGFIVAFGLIFIVLSVQQLNNDKTNTDFAIEGMGSQIELGFSCQYITANASVGTEDEFISAQLDTQISVGESDYYSVGDTIPFSVTINNPFMYDITGADLLLALVYTPRSSVVDYISHPDSLTIPAQGSITVDVPMVVPNTISTGAHTAVAYVGQVSQEVLLSNALVRDEGQGSASLSLFGNGPESGQTIRIMNGGGVSVSGESVLDEAVRKVPALTEEATVRLTMLNTYETPVSGTLTWKVYGGLTPHPALLIDTSSEDLSFDPADSSLIRTLDLGLDYNQYSVVAELVYEDSRQLAYIPFEKEGTVISNAIPPFIQLTHLGLDESGKLVGCLGSRNPTGSATDVVSRHLPVPFEVDLAFYSDKETMESGGSPIAVIKGGETVTSLHNDDLGFSAMIGNSRPEYFLETTLYQFGEEISRDQFMLSCKGSECQK